MPRLDVELQSVDAAHVMELLARFKLQRGIVPALVHIDGRLPEMLFSASEH